MKDDNKINLAPIKKPNVHFDTNVSSDKKDNNESFIDKEKKKWPFVLILVLLVLIGGFYYYYHILTKPSILFNKVIDNSFNYLSGYINKEKNRFNDEKYSMNASVIFTSSDLKYILYNSLKANFDMEVDFTSNISVSNINVTLLENELFNFDIGTDDDNIYFKYIDEKNEEKIYKSKINNELKNNENSNDMLNAYSHLSNILVETIKGNVSENKIKKTPKIIKDGDKSIPVYALNYLIDRDEYGKILSALIDNIINDSNALDSMLLLGFGESREDIIKTLNEYLDNFTFGSNIEVSMYLDIIKNDLLELDISNNVYKVNVKKDDIDVVVSVQYKKNEDENIEVLITFDKIEKRIVMSFDCDVVKDDDALKFNFSITYKDNSTSNDEVDSLLSIKVYDVTKTNNELFNIDSTFKIKKIDKVELFDTDNALDFDMKSNDDVNIFDLLLKNNVTTTSNINE